MANIFEQYGIKEVADVTIYKVVKEGDATKEVPFLFLDTLKVSTVEQTAEQTDARGGKGNPKLITWDYGKEINVTLEDALYSPASMALMFGGDTAEWTDTETTVKKMLLYTATASDVDAPTEITDGNGYTWAIDNWLGEDGKVSSTAPTMVKGKTYRVEVSATASKVGRLTIEADDFPGTYKLVGDTYARNRDTGIDEYFQFIIPRAKMSAEQTLTLEAEGDPTTFNMNMTVLRPADGKMMELVQYTLSKN